ncbi:MAG: long-chain fatty acid--CoA ligase [Acidobacteria bacterium]|nr:long-chain fatty acid--CoA ligase [Acidobacteriota bacterium]MBI3663647.1 long-chain fatty acid--CoA ligase [Acidobacteriota bacterium]
MAYPALTQSLLDAIDRQPPDKGVMLSKVGERWQSVTARELLRRIAGLSRALAELGVKTDDRVGLFSANRPEWHIADFAVVGLGAINVPIYFNESPERITYILNDCGAKLVIAFGHEQVRRLLGCRERAGAVEHIIVGAAPPEIATDVLRYEALISSAGDADVAEYRRRAAQVNCDQVATIIYTSGTTGVPKGVMLTHSNLTANTIDSFQGLQPVAGDVGLSFLPLAHVYERIVDYGYFFYGVPIAYVGKMEQLAAALREVRPTLAAAVPRVFEKLYAAILASERQVTGWRRRIYEWAMNVARKCVLWRAYGKSVSPWLKLQWHIANRLAYAKVRAGVGGRMRAFISGAAPLSKDMLEFFWSVDLRVYQGYGLTETSPIVSSSNPLVNRVGAVGRPIPNVDVRIAEDGEILVKGPCVMRGYYNKPAETAEVLSSDGWLHTGDIGHLDADGFLYVTDRKKDLIKTAAGKFVAPQPIENGLKTSPFISGAVIVGDRRRFIIALIVPNFDAVEAKGRETGLSFSSPAEIAAHPWVRDLIRGEIERLTSHLAQYETIKRFALLDHDFSFEDGQLTYSMKIKRHVVEQRYHDLIARLYTEEDEPRPLPSCEKRQ